MEKIWIVDGKFKLLTIDEMKKLGDDAAEYADALNVYRAEKHQEIQDLVEKNNEDNKKAIQELKDSFAEMTKSQMSSLSEAVKQQGLTITKMRKVTIDATEKKMSIGDQIKKAFKENPDAHTEWKEKKGSFKFDLKVDTMLSSTNVSGGFLPVEDREQGLNRIARRRPFIISLISSGSTSSTTVSWAEQQNPDGTTGGTNEGATKNQIDFDIVIVNETIKKRTNFIKISDEMLDDIDFIESEIRTELLELLGLDLDDQVLQGDGTGNNLNGIITQATPFAAGGLTDQIDEANNWDVLVAAILQIEIENHFANVVVMHPTDIKLMKLTKDDHGQYVMPPFQSADGMIVEGLPIISNIGISIGDFLVMDGTKSKVFFRQGITIEMGFDADDFTKNLRTIRAEVRALNRIKGNDETAFVTGDFTSAKAALETP